MAPADWHLAQVNVSTLLEPIDSPRLEGFVAELDPVNATADAAPGFVWRLMASRRQCHLDSRLRRSNGDRQPHRVGVDRGARGVRVRRSRPSGRHARAERLVRATPRGVVCALVDPGRSATHRRRRRRATFPTCDSTARRPRRSHSASGSRLPAPSCCPRSSPATARSDAGRDHRRCRLPRAPPRAPAARRRRFGDHARPCSPR